MIKRIGNPGEDGYEYTKESMDELKIRKQIDAHTNKTLSITIITIAFIIMVTVLTYKVL